MKICGIWPENSGTNVEKFCYMLKVAPFGKTASGQTRPSLIFLLSSNKKIFNRAVNLPSTYPEEISEEKCWNYKKTVSILNDKLSNFEQLLFVRVAKTAWYESIGTSCAKYLQETMSHYFSFLQFSSNKFSVWCWNCILRVQRKSLTYFFSEVS